MSKILVEQTATLELRKRAWKALVKELGIVDALWFVMATEPSSGDSVQEYRKI